MLVSYAVVIFMFDGLVVCDSVFPVCGWWFLLCVVGWLFADNDVLEVIVWVDLMVTDWCCDCV